MAVPVSQAWTVATYVLKQKLQGRKKYPLVLMLEPLFRCNLACAGCGKIQYPAHILKEELTPEECFKAVEECGTPMVSIPGGEPLMHPQMPEIVAGLVARKKYVYMCTNALLLKEKLHLFKPSKYLSFSVHVDGQREHHDFSVCREGGYDIAMEGVHAAVAAGFRVTTNTTLFDGADPNSVRAHFDEMMAVGVESMMVSPGYTYDKAPDQKHFLGRARSKKLFRAILSNRKKTWRFNASPMFMEFLMGKQRPHLHAVGHADLLHLRLAEALLPAAGRLRRHLPGADGDGRVAELRHRVRQSAVRELHGPLRLRGQRRELHLRLPQGSAARRRRPCFFDTYEDDGAQTLLNEWKPAQPEPAGADCDAPRRRPQPALQESLRRLSMATETQESREARTARRI